MPAGMLPPFQLRCYSAAGSFCSKQRHAAEQLEWRPEQAVLSTVAFMLALRGDGYLGIAEPC